MGKHFRTLSEAIGVRRFVVGSTVAAATGLFQWLAAFEQMSWLAIVPPWAVGGAIFVGLLFWWLLAFATEYRQKAEPCITLEFESEYPFVYLGEREGQNFRVYRFRATNEGGQVLHHCQAQMARAVQDDGLQTVNIAFSLRQSLNAKETFTLRRGEEIFVDVLSVPTVPGEAAVAPVAHWGQSTSFPALGNGAAALALQPTNITVQVLSEGAPAKMVLRFEPGPSGAYILRRLSVEV